ncbi:MULTISPECIES: 50S ribosomal protein L6 [Aminobacterium]|jgi:large subunit ribosomal protein L6|uniref:50S ribosomal protein L6 n=1 Tax=Aminobacterium TaxID=81466 RepID=UPI00257C8CE6|nr:50S ribosomal protein L6 [Aminobacterium sp. UBA4987]
MSRIGRKPIPLAKGATVTIKDDKVIVKGPKGELCSDLVPGITVSVEDSGIVVERENDEKQTRAFHGMVRALIANMVTGVTEGFVKNLEIVGVGYRAQMQGSKLILNVGYSNPIEYEPPKGVEIATESPIKISVRGIDRQLVGQVAAIIREFRSPEPYKGKGIRYAGEYIIRKAGKASAK